MLSFHTLIRLRRPIVPVRIRRRVVQIRVERADMQPVVRVAPDMGGRAAQPFVISSGTLQVLSVPFYFSIYLRGRAPSCRFAPIHPPASGLQESAAPPDQVEYDAVPPRPAQNAPTSNPVLEAPPTRA